MCKLFTVLGLCMALPACTVSPPQIATRFELAGREVHATVDSDIARYYLEHHLRGDRLRPELDALINTIEHDIRNGAPLRDSLQTVSRSYSTDLAALILWRHILREPANQRAQRMYLEELSRLKMNPGSGPELAPAEKGYLIVFVPGWFYQSQPENGADFAQVRRVLNDAGARTALLEIEENGSVERNAVRIGEQLIRYSHDADKIIVVSASKAGPEVALALTTLRQSGAIGNVKAWVNIGGVLRGTALADTALTWPACWFVKLSVIDGGSFDGIESLATGPSVERASRTNLPAGLVVVNYVGIPLSGQVSDRARLGYWLLRSEGPNDGLTPVVDEIPADSITVTELGLDHFFKDPDIHLKTVALTKAVVRYVERRAIASNMARR